MNEKTMVFLLAMIEGPAGYTVIVPDLPGCFTSGNTVMEAKEMAVKAIQRHLSSKFSPLRKPFIEHARRRELLGAYFCYVKVGLSKTTVKSDMNKNNPV